MRSTARRNSSAVAAQRWLCRRIALFSYRCGVALQVLRRKRREVVEAVRNEKVLASGRPLEAQMRTEPRTAVNARIDPYKIRPGAMKMVLPQEEEAKLALVRPKP